MKKSLILTLVVAMLFSFCWGKNFGMTAQAETVEHKNAFEFSEKVDFSDIGNGNAAGHGNHQTRVVHTTHGDYVTFITNTSSNSNGEKLDEFKVIRVNEDNSYEVVFTEYKIYDTSQVGLFVDKNENVWAVTVGANNYRQNTGTDSIMANAWMIDKETDDVSNYNIVVPRKTWGGYGYSYFCYDEAMDRLYTLTASGDEPGELVWLIFDMKTMTWDNTARSIETKYRNCYPYIYADGKGGMVIVNECDHKATSLGYPEVSTNYGLTQDDIQSIQGSYQSSSGEWKRPSADYVFDQLELYYITDVYKEEYEMFIVAEADYSRVKGTQEERYSLEFRAVNEYPTIQNNNGGDTFLDADGYLHVIYSKEFVLAAYNNNMATDEYWYHDVIDISDPKNIKKLSSTLIVDYSEENFEYSHSYRMYQTTDGNLYIISVKNSGYFGNVVVLSVNGNVNDGYTYEEVASEEHVGDRVICISNNRSNSVDDDVITYVWRNGDHNMYRFKRITVSCAHSDLKWEHDDTKHWQTCNDCDGKINEGDHDFKWVTDKEATYKETGLKHEECKCGLKRNENTVIDKVADPEVGDNDMTFWILFVTSFTMLVGVTVVLNKKRKSAG